jgi:hypothetical protein
MHWPIRRSVKSQACEAPVYVGELAPLDRINAKSDAPSRNASKCVVETSASASESFQNDIYAAPGLVIPSPEQMVPAVSYPEVRTLQPKCQQLVDYQRARNA